MKTALIRTAKLKFVAESRTRVDFAQHGASTGASTATLYFAAKQVGHKRGNTRNNVIQLATEQCYEKSLRKLLPIVPDL